MTSSTLVKCNSMIDSIVMSSYPNVTLFLLYLISKHWNSVLLVLSIWKSTTIFSKPADIKHNPKNILIHLFNSRVCSQSTLITSFTNLTSSAIVELFCITALEAGQTHVVLLVFGIRLRFMQAKQKLPHPPAPLHDPRWTKPRSCGDILQQSHIRVTKPARNWFNEIFLQAFATENCSSLLLSSIFDRLELTVSFSHPCDSSSARAIKIPAQHRNLSR